ncbi:MAG TPA: hypothetical protein VE823_22610 [Geodermatophilus sp.]|nr:hypothetical protein [Geodermatophilus sp.]
MLSHDEQRAWNEIRRRYAREAEEPALPVIDLEIRRPRSSTPAVLAAVVAVGCIAVLLVVLGAPVAGLAIAVASVPPWLLWRHWPLLDGGVVVSARTAPRVVPAPVSTTRRRNPGTDAPRGRRDRGDRTAALRSGATGECENRQPSVHGECLDHGRGIP